MSWRGPYGSEKGSRCGVPHTQTPKQGMGHKDVSGRGPTKHNGLTAPEGGCRESPPSPLPWVLEPAHGVAQLWAQGAATW